ncbi:Uncharacterized conserved protein [Maritimibacter sp. HL-12]|nr:Uncharacterized conserved protein [Maritimibacter sp. HL-12]
MVRGCTEIMASSPTRSFSPIAPLHVTAVPASRIMRGNPGDEIRAWHMAWIRLGNMSRYSRRGFMVAIGGGGLALAGCGNGMGSEGPARIDARVEATLQQMYSDLPDSRRLEENAVGMLVMPLVTEAGFGVGGSYGRGALMVGGAAVDYYAHTKASFGLQIGAQQYAHVLFFMTDDALADFRTASGWVAGADLKYAVANEGGRISADSITTTSPVVALVFGQAGLILGASLEGSKYTRIIP